MNDDILNFIKRWNERYPVDFWWRKKHKVPFNGSVHRNQSLLDMKIEYEEERMYEEQIESLVSEKSKSKYEPGRGILFDKDKNANKMSDAQIDEAFDKIDIDSIEEDGNEITM